MKIFICKSVAVFVVVAVVSFMTGCTVSTRNIAPDEEVIYDEGYHFSDKKKIVDHLVDSLLSKPPLAGADDRPVLVVYGIANRTAEHISTGGISDDIREALIKSGKVRFINKAQRENIENEVRFQYGGNVDTSTAVFLASQVGAKYMLTGTLRSIEKEQPRQVRLKKKVLKYYSLNLELTDIETSVIEWADSAEVIREAARPFIGW